MCVCVFDVCSKAEWGKVREKKTFNNGARIIQIYSLYAVKLRDFLRISGITSVSRILKTYFVCNVRHVWEANSFNEFLQAPRNYYFFPIEIFSPHTPKFLVISLTQRPASRKWPKSIDSCIKSANSTRHTFIQY